MVEAPKCVAEKVTKLQISADISMTSLDSCYLKMASRETKRPAQDPMHESKAQEFCLFFFGGSRAS